MMISRPLVPSILWIAWPLLKPSYGRDSTEDQYSRKDGCSRVTGRIHVRDWIRPSVSKDPSPNLVNRRLIGAENGRPFPISIVDRFSCIRLTLYILEIQQIQRFFPQNISLTTPHLNHSLYLILIKPKQITTWDAWRHNRRHHCPTLPSI